MLIATHWTLPDPQDQDQSIINHMCVCVCVSVSVCVYLPGLVFWRHLPIAFLQKKTPGWNDSCKSLLVVNNIKIFTNQITLIEWTMSCPWTAPNIFVMKIEKQWKLLIILIKFGNTEIFSDLHDIIDKLAHFLFHSVQFGIVLQRKGAKLWILEQDWNTFFQYLEWLN